MSVAGMDARDHLSVGPGSHERRLPGASLAKRLREQARVPHSGQDARQPLLAGEDVVGREPLDAGADLRPTFGDRDDALDAAIEQLGALGERDREPGILLRVQALDGGIDVGERSGRNGRGRGGEGHRGQG